MDEEHFNMQIRKFLKQVGVTSQREIETAVRAALDSGKLAQDGSVTARVTLSVPELGISHDIVSDLTLEPADPHDPPSYD
ncbi:MAG: hypothetical protein COW30_18160 [Rhodospirillales bacterium CG15_BIG_FIL_POST_REV_8_21_14_020_66_15]|nr:MAG: hypothetical protein COW30_18160 [Rhodospirillales bacterium CG15_BIG_FIL_POST_REV_8_21_14_020_66_15]